MRVGVAPPLPFGTPRLRGTHGCQRMGAGAVGDAMPDGADTGVDVQ
jgi:hypothetical protein